MEAEGLQDGSISSPFISCISISCDPMSPQTLAELFAEVLKSLVHQKMQIPYCFLWLEHYVEKSMSEQCTKSQKKNLAAHKYLKTAHSAFNWLVTISNNLHTEFQANSIVEVAIVFGANLLTAKEVYCFKIPSVGHCSNGDKVQKDAIRQIFVSKPWLEAASRNIPATNTYVLLKKLVTNTLLPIDCYFLPKQSVTVPKTAHVLNIDLSFKWGSGPIASNSFGEMISPEKPQGEYMWFLAKDFMKGFRDMYVND